jgi:1-deoxy-D-xylulose-5-phosphate synthase
VWDVGHQAYPHKILTGRNERIPTIRRKGGLSGFLKRDESEYDTFGAGHAATSISAACGMAAARDLLGKDHEVVAIIGDGSMTCGLAFEALNNAGHTDRDMVVVLNDNQMSISPNVGALHKYLTNVRTSPFYNRVREEVKKLIHSAPKLGSIGEMVEQFAVRADDAVKGMFVPGMLFEELGFRYVGPVDGHDVDQLVETFEDVRKMKGPRLVHVITTKGKGFAPAEEDQVKWHAGGGFDKDTGAPLQEVGPVGSPRYQAVFGEALTELGREYPQVVTITAAMAEGTSTNVFERPTRSGSSTWGSPRGTPSPSRRGSRRRGSSPWSRSTRPSSSAPTTPSSTTWRSRTCRSSSAWTGRGSPATTAPRTTAASTSATCSPFRG